MAEAIRGAYKVTDIDRLVFREKSVNGKKRVVVYYEELVNKKWERVNSDSEVLLPDGVDVYYKEQVEGE